MRPLRRGSSELRRKRGPRRRQIAIPGKEELMRDGTLEVL
jgi:hypothetical protein